MWIPYWSARMTTANNSLFFCGTNHDTGSRKQFRSTRYSWEPMSSLQVLFCPKLIAQVICPGLTFIVQQSQHMFWNCTVTQWMDSIVCKHVFPKFDGTVNVLEGTKGLRGSNPCGTQSIQWHCKPVACKYLLSRLNKLQNSQHTVQSPKCLLTKMWMNWITCFSVCK